MVQPEATQPAAAPAPAAGLATPVRQAIAQLDELVNLVTSMLTLFSGDALSDASAKAKLQAFGQQYQAKSAQLRASLQRVGLSAASQQPSPSPPSPSEPSSSAQPAAGSQSSAGQQAAGVPADVAAELERLKRVAAEKNGVLFKLITQLRDMLDSTVMWETFGRSLAQETGKKHDRK